MCSHEAVYIIAIVMLVRCLHGQAGDYGLSGDDDLITNNLILRDGQSIIIIVTMYIALYIMISTTECISLLWTIYLKLVIDVIVQNGTMGCVTLLK